MLFCQQLRLQLFRDCGARMCATVVSRHHRAAYGAVNAGVLVDDVLLYGDAFVSDAFHSGGDRDVVVIAYLGGEIDLEMDNHHREVALLGRYSCFGEKLRFAQVEILHDDGVVHMPHLIDVVESYLNR